MALATNVARADTIVVDEAFEEVGLGKHLELAYDPSGRVGIEAVLTGTLEFTPSKKDVPSFGYRRGAEWARVTIVDERREPGVLRVENGYGQRDRLDLFEVVGGTLRRTASAGVHVPLAQWEHVARTPTYALPARAVRTVYFRLEGGASHQLPLTLVTAARSEHRLLADAVAQALFYGALLIMVGYNALVAAVTRSKAYALYVAFLCSNGILHLAYTGLLPPLGIAVPWLVDFTVPVTVSSTIGLSILFTNELLGLSSLQPRTAQRLDRFAVGHAVAVAFAILVGYSTAIRVALAGAVPWAVALIATAYREQKRGSRVARLYLLAWVSFLLGAVTVGLRNFGVLPVNGFTNGASSIGAALEFLLLSFALADRIKQLQAQATANAELAAVNARAAEEASARALAEQERTNRELQRLDKLKDEFLANTSHELRTPLHGILGLTEGVLRSAGGLDRGSRDRLEMVVASGRRLASLVNDILDFSKLRHQELELREKNLELRGAVAMTMTVLSPSATSKDLTLVNAVPEGLAVRADESRLQQILTNLIGNAVKFTASGRVAVSARVRDDGRVIVSVQDTGIGIAPAAQARVFESFEQGDGSTAREFGGTGLGLAVTKQLVELHGGTIGLESVVGQGSTFSFDLACAGEGAPVEASHSPAPARATPSESVVDRGGSDLGSLGNMPIASAPSAETVVRTKRARLLVADDDPVNLEVLKAQLEPEGHEVVVARDGAQAVETLATAGPFDGVLLDVMMPKMTGPQAAEQMRASYPHGTLPILMLTAKNRPEDAVTGLRAGADDYVGKPFHRDELLARLDVHLDSARTTRALERFVRPRLVELAGRPRPSELVAGEGRGVNAILARFTLEGLGELAAKHDERTFFERVERVVRALVEQVELHGGVVESMSDDQLSAIFTEDAATALLGAQRALWAAQDVSAKPLRLSALVHAGSVNVGAVGSEDWVAVHALGEAALVASAVGRWSVRNGFGLVVTDAVRGKLESPPGGRYLGSARIGAAGHPVSLYEVGEGLVAFDAALRSLERGDFTGAKAEAKSGTGAERAPLASAIAEAAERGLRDVAAL